MAEFIYDVQHKSSRSTMLLLVDDARKKETSRQQMCRHIHIKTEHKREMYFGKNVVNLPVCVLLKHLCLTVCSLSLSDTLYCEELNEKIRLLYRLHIPPGDSFSRPHGFKLQSGLRVIH